MMRDYIQHRGWQAAEAVAIDGRQTLCRAAAAVTIDGIKPAVQVK